MSNYTLDCRRLSEFKVVHFTFIVIIIIIKFYKKLWAELRNAQNPFRFTFRNAQIHLE